MPQLNYRGAPTPATIVAPTAGPSRDVMAGVLRLDPGMQPQAYVQAGAGSLHALLFGEQPLEVVPDDDAGAHAHRVVGERQDIGDTGERHGLEVLVRASIDVCMSIDHTL